MCEYQLLKATSNKPLFASNPFLVFGTFTIRNAVITTRYVNTELTSCSLLQGTDRRFRHHTASIKPDDTSPNRLDGVITKDYRKQKLLTVWWRDDTQSYFYLILTI